ncbi:MAG TPA: M56 family metallopeptidase [Syntrophomonas sp.]|nr:M56 family metallopeptidase [Syntrophomonas sp.]
MECSVTMTALALGFMALTPWLSKRYDAKWLYYVWLVLVIGFIIPFRFHPDTPLLHNDLFVNAVAMQQTAFDKLDIMEQGQPQDSPQSNLINDPGTNRYDRETVSGIMRKILNSPWYLWAGTLWIFGAVIFIAFHGIRHKHFLQMVRRWSQKVSDQQTLDTLQGQKLGLGILKRVELRTCACITSPMMIGLVNPVILLPQAEYSEGELSLILRHELVHIKRKDLWYKILVLLATAIHWFNPVVYLMVKAIAVQCEISCDMEVVKNTEMDKRQLYSETILDVVKHNGRMQTAFSTNFYGGKKEMKNRIFTIMDGSKKKTGIFILCAALILTFSSGVVFAADADNTEDKNSYTIEVYNDTTKINFINEPFIRDGELYLPLRETLAAFGIDDIKFDDREIQIEMPVFDSNYQGFPPASVCQITIGSPQVKFPTHYVPGGILRTAPVIKNDTTYVPVDFFESLIIRGQIPRFSVKLIQPSDPSAYYSEDEEVYIGTASQQDSYNPVDENGNRKLIKRIITDEDGKAVALVTVENQRPKVLSNLQNRTPAFPRLGAPDFESIFNAPESIFGINAYGEYIDFSEGILVQKNGEFIAYIPPAYQINKPAAVLPKS